MAYNKYKLYDERNEKIFKDNCMTGEDSTTYVKNNMGDNKKIGVPRNCTMGIDILPKQFVLENFTNSSILETEDDEIFVQKYAGPAGSTPELLVIEPRSTQPNFEKMIRSYYSVVGSKFYKTLNSVFGKDTEAQVRELSKAFIEHLGNYADALTKDKKPIFLPNAAQLGRELEKATAAENLWNRNEMMKKVCDLFGDSIEMSWAANLEGSKGLEPLKKDPNLEVIDYKR